MKREKKKSPWMPMHPLRKRLLCIGLPLYFVLALVGGVAVALIDLFVLTNENTPVWLIVVWIIWFALLSAIMLMISAKVTKIELKADMERFAYFWKEPTPLESETVVPDDVEGAYCELTKEGICIRFEEKCREQVFDELPENVFFVPWERAEYFLVTQNVNHRVQIGFAVVIPNASDQPDEEAVFVLLMQEKVYTAMHAFGLMEKTAMDWAYWQYNPQDAFKQILRYGQVRHLRDKDTGKILKNDTDMFRW